MNKNENDGETEQFIFYQWPTSIQDVTASLQDQSPSTQGARVISSEVWYEINFQNMTGQY